MNTANHPKRGVAMFVVLGAILVVTLLGMAGMTMAQKDQTLALDVQDLRSRNEALDAAFQTAINALTASPDNLVSILDTFIVDETANKGSSARRFLSFDVSPVGLLTSDTGWHSISSLGEKNAIKVDIVAVGTYESTAAIVDSVFLTLHAWGRGRDGDETEGRATYRLHGIGRKYTTTTTSFRMPQYALYLGSNMPSSNSNFNITGGAYIGGTPTNNTDVGLNATADLNIKGVFKWNGTAPFTINAKNTKAVFDGPAYIQGGIRFNATGTAIEFKQDAGITGGIQQLSGNILSAGRLWINGKCSPEPCAMPVPVTISADKGLAIEDLSGFSNYGLSIVSTQGDVFLGEGFGALPPTSGNFTLTGDSVFAGGNLTVVADNYSARFNVGKLFKVGQNFWGYVRNGKTLSIDGAGASPYTIGGDFKSKFFFEKPNNHAIQISGVRDIKFPTYTNPTAITAGSTVQPGTFSDPTPPFPTTLGGVGLPAWLTAVNRASNPADQAMIDSKSPVVLANAQSHKWSTFGAGKNLNGCDLSALYTQERNNGGLINEYLAIEIDKQVTISTTGCATNAVSGKFAFLVEELVYVNIRWPYSKTKDDIQLISVVGPTGRLANWGFTGGDFSGIIYWKDPSAPAGACALAIAPKGKCNQMQFPDIGASTRTLNGAILIDESITDPATVMYFNGGALNINKDPAVFQDIAKNLPGVLRSPPGTPAGLDPNAQPVTVTSTTPTNMLQLLTTQVSATTLGLYR